jgi:hypothetical protein
VKRTAGGERTGKSRPRGAGVPARAVDAEAIRAPRAGRRSDPAVEIVRIYQPDLRREVSALLLVLARAQLGDRALVPPGAGWHPSPPSGSTERRAGGDE